MTSDYPFPTLVSRQGDTLEADHLPTAIDDEPAPLGRVRFHVAGANPVAGALDAGDPVLLVYTAAHAYVSPDGSRSSGLVPTWNYAVVHARGRARRLGEWMHDGV